MKIYFTEQPDDIRYIEGTYTTVSDKKAQEFIDAGLAVSYPPKFNDEPKEELILEEE